MTREELEEEVARLRAALAEAGLDAQRVNDRQTERDEQHRADLAESRQQTADADQRTLDARSDARDAAVEHRRQIAGATADLTASEDMVAELRLSQLAIVASEARQRAIFDNAADIAMVVTDPAGTITDWNTGAEKVMGWTADEMRGQGVERFFTPEDRVGGRVEHEMVEALRAGRAADERWHLRKGGERFWASGEMMPLFDDQDRHLGFVKVLRDRTGEHLEGLAVRQEQERFHTIIDNIDAAFAFVRVKFDAEDRPINYFFLEANPAFEEQAGVDLRGKWVTDYAPDLEGFWFETYGHVAKTGEPANFENYAEAFKRWFDVRAVRVGDPDDRTIAILFNDVTARHEAQDRLRLSEASARENIERVQLALAAGAIIGTWHWDIPSDQFTVDEAFARAFGLDPALGREGIPLAQIVATVHPDDQAGLAEAIDAAIARGGAYAHQYRVRRTDGRYYWIEANGRVDRGPDGTPQSFPGVLIDVEERRAVEAERDRATASLRALNETLEQQVQERTEGLRRAEEELLRVRQQEADARLAARDRLRVELADAMRDLTHPDQIMATVATHVGRYFGVEQANYYVIRDDRFVVAEEWRTGDSAGMVGDHPLSAFPEAVVSSLREGYVLRANDTRQIEGADAFAAFGMRAALSVPVRNQGQWAGGLHLSQTTPRTWTDEDEVLLREIAGAAWSEVERANATLNLRQLAETLEQRVADRTDELMKAEERLRQSQKMEAIGQLTGGVAHDFNNLLTVIRGSVDLLRRDNVAPEKRQRYLDAIGDTADRAAKLTGQLLAFARRQTLEPEVFDVAHRLDGITDMLDSITGTRVLVRFEMPVEVCRIKADVSQFETALVNLAVNARDAMDGEGTVTIRLRGNARMPAIRGHGAGTGSFVAISLSDTGIGINADDLERIFEPFFTTKDVGRGTGLGLSQVFGFAKQSGGDVDVESMPGRGSTFTLYLPQADPATAEETKPTDQQQNMDGEGRCVLVVEDNISVGQFATQLLDDLGYRTAWVTSAEEALERLGPTGDGFDIVFSDVVMPGMGGIELAKRLARDLPALPVVLASGYSHVLVQEGVEGMELLRKPYSATQLSSALQRRIMWAIERAK